MEKPETFKLDETDRKVLSWLTDNVDVQSLQGWIEYVTEDYENKGVFIDGKKLYREIQEKAG